MVAAMALGVGSIVAGRYPATEAEVRGMIQNRYPGATVLRLTSSQDEHHSDLWVCDDHILRHLEVNRYLSPRVIQERSLENSRECASNRQGMQ